MKKSAKNPPDQFTGTINSTPKKQSHTGVSEMRIFYGPGYREYFKDTGKEMIILSCGGNKSTRSTHIEKAKNFAKRF